MEMLGARASEVAGVLAERRLLGQPRQALDFVLVRGCLALRCPEQQQLQQEQRPLLSSNHLRRKRVPAVYWLPGCSAPACNRPWGGAGGVPARKASARPQLSQPNLLRLPHARQGAPGSLPASEFPHLCSPTSLLSRRCLATGSHVYAESRVLRCHVTDFLPSSPVPEHPGDGLGEAAAVHARSGSASLAGHIPGTCDQMTQVGRPGSPNFLGGPVLDGMSEQAALGPSGRASGKGVRGEIPYMVPLRSPAEPAAQNSPWRPWACLVAGIWLLSPTPWNWVRPGDPRSPNSLQPAFIGCTVPTSAWTPPGRGPHAWRASPTACASVMSRWPRARYSWSRSRRKS